ncbi:cation-translocating P-type ATPase [Candidatus Saccharibacteria bacterium]|nr:cation-translocating P-type ATPase [Candidatus Saccharibacteria bacterium]
MKHSGNSIARIIAKNTFTLFNLVNIILAAMVAFVGSYKNMLFIIIAIANTLISIVNEIRAKKIVDKMRLLSEQRATVIRDGKSLQIAPEEVVKGDRLVLSLGDQVMYDSVVATGHIEVNESFITGEQDNIGKSKGDKLTSGSFVVSGTAEAIVEHVGADNFVTKLQSEAHTIKTADSQLFSLMNKIVKYISYALVPVGALLLWSRFRTESDTATAVTSTVAALINMIPEGLILLTSSVLALATIRLSRKKVLVQDLYAIETLARVDRICLDKTGTLTTGRMTVRDILLPDGSPIDMKSPTTPSEKCALTALAAILSHQTSENATVSALRAKLARVPKNALTGDFPEVTDVIAFSSDRKYSGIKTADGEYLMGAIDFLTSDQSTIEMVKSLSGDYRTVAIVRTTKMPLEESVGASEGDRNASFEGPKTWASAPERPEKEAFGQDPRPISASMNRGARDGIFANLRDQRVALEATEPRNDGREGAGRKNTILASLLCIIRLEDEIRPSAPKIIKYFYDNDIAVNVISGDDLASVTAITEKVGVKNAKGINLSALTRPNYKKLVSEYNIFTRVTPAQKKELVKAMRASGNTVAMTGDGVNDILAMKEADVSLAIGEGTDAARRAAKFVLLDSGYDGVPAIIDEGRQSINNLERSTSLFLAKTVYATILAVIFVFLPFSYPFSPIEMSLLNFVCIGFPGLILALEKNTERIKNKFVTNIIEYSVPIGFTVSFAMLLLSILSHHNNFTRFELTTTSVFITFAIDLILIYWVSRPLNLLRSALLITIIGIMAAAFLIPFAREFFEFTFLTPNGLIIMASIIALSVALFFLLRHLARRLSLKLLPLAG